MEIIAQCRIYTKQKFMYRLKIFGHYVFHPVLRKNKFVYGITSINPSVWLTQYAVRNTKKILLVVNYHHKMQTICYLYYLLED